MLCVCLNLSPNNSKQITYLFINFGQVFLLNLEIIDLASLAVYKASPRDSPLSAPYKC